MPPFQNLAYVGQATHLTTIKKYVDTLNFAILSSKTGTTVNAFSISDVGGAFGDEGAWAMRPRAALLVYKHKTHTTPSIVNRDGPSNHPEIPLIQPIFFSCD